MIEIRSRSDSSCVLYRSETAETIRAAVVEAVAAGADLADAYLADANLAGDENERLCAQLAAAREALLSFGQHEIGCPGWYREVRTENDPSPPVKCINDPCDCGLDAALKALEGEP